MNEVSEFHSERQVVTMFLVMKFASFFLLNAVQCECADVVLAF